MSHFVLFVKVREEGEKKKLIPRMSSRFMIIFIIILGLFDFHWGFSISLNATPMSLSQ